MRGTRAFFCSTILAVAWLVLFSGCVARTVRTVEMRSTPSFQGKSLDEVIKVWGPIGTPEPDGKGGQIVTYRMTGVVHSVPDPAHAGPSDDPSTYDNPVTTDAARSLKDQRHYDEGDVIARFWVGPDNLVYRFYFAASVWKKQPEKTAPHSPAGESP